MCSGRRSRRKARSSAGAGACSRGTRPGGELAVTTDLHGLDGALLDAGVQAQLLLDFAQLDAEAANLHLVVDAAQVLDAAVGQEAREVTRLVEAGTRAGAEGVGQVDAGGELGAVEVAAAQALAGDVELTGHADGDLLQVLVEDVDGAVGQGPADGHGNADRRRRGDVVEGGEDGALGGAVAVDQPARRAVLEELA